MMLSKLQSKLSMAAFCLNFLLLAAASDAAFNVRPVRVFLPKGTNNQDLEVQNTSRDESVKIQLFINRWSQDEKGVEVLTPTKDILAFPVLMELKPGEKKIVRVGTRVPHATKEQTYRVLVKQLPSKEIGKPKPNPDGKSTFQVNFIVNASVPVFIEPLKVERQAQLTDAKVANGSLDFNIKNTGNAHITPGDINLQLLGENDQEIEKGKLNAGYILGGVTRQYTTAIPQTKCQQVKAILIDASNSSNPKHKLANLKQKIDTPAGVCTTK
jgi:fimbrial chaperone protein